MKTSAAQDRILRPSSERSECKRTFATVASDLTTGAAMIGMVMADTAAVTEAAGPATLAVAIRLKAAATCGLNLVML